MLSVLDRGLNKIEFIRDRDRIREPLSHADVRDVSAHRYGYRPVDDPLAALRELLGAPSAVEDGFAAHWAVLAEAGSGLDCDRLLAHVLYHTVRHIRPAYAVETGVARGVSTRFILIAMEENGRGSLASIEVHDEDARYVPAALRARWRFHQGTSRRLLGDLCSRQVDVFVHDSQHTYRNMKFECELGYAALRCGGVLVADDIHENSAFAELVESTAAPHFVGQETVKSGLFGVALKPR